MDNKKLKKTLVINQEIANILFIVALFITLYLLEQKRNNGMTAHCINPDTKMLALLTKILILCVYIYFAVISYIAYQSTNSKPDRLAFYASLIAVVPPAIMVYAFVRAMYEGEQVNNPLL